MSYLPSGCVVLAPVNQTTTSAFVPVPGTLIDLAQAALRDAIYVIQETGGLNGVNFKIQASVDQVTWFDFAVDSYGQNGVSTSGSGSVPQPVAAGTAVVAMVPFMSPGRYLQVAIQDEVSGSHGTVVVSGVAL